MYAVGIMSGTSLDGVDIALAKIEGNYTDTKIELIAFETYEIPEGLIKKIKKACSYDQSSTELICSLNFELGYLFSEYVIKLCKDYNFDISKLDFIASHGQTIWHIPFNQTSSIASTLQIGEASIIAYQCGCKVISDFRVMDMAAGGQGAPLVPFSDYILYSKLGQNIALENIGGIGNVTYLDGSLDINKILAFDTGPGNMMINEACLKLFNKPYDQDGLIALSGKVNKKLLDELMAHDYFKLEPPKSTGREMFGVHYVDSLLKKYNDINKADIITTFTMFTAKSIEYHYRKYLMQDKPLDLIVITGGGAHNKALFKMIFNLLKEIKVCCLEDLGHNSDAKEALAFIVLGNETLNNSFSNVKSATGAKESVVLGKITLAPK